MIKAKDIEIFKNISQEEYGGRYYDFHNDFDCVKISMAKKELMLDLKSVLNKQIVKICFLNVSIVMFDFFNLNNEIELTIDNLYRGKTVVNGNLVEFENHVNGYFYLDFVDGQKVEFWSTGLCVI